jgi:hypothetical protein
MPSCSEMPLGAAIKLKEYNAGVLEFVMLTTITNWRKI